MKTIEELLSELRQLDVKVWNELKASSQFTSDNMSSAHQLKELLSGETQNPNEVARQLEILQNTFQAVEEQLSQISSLSLALPPSLLELYSKQWEIEAQSEEEVQRSFDLAQETLLRLGQEDGVLISNMQRLINSDSAAGILLQELIALFEASISKPSPLPDLYTPSADFTNRQRQYLQSEILKSQLNYWKQRLDGSVPVLLLPIDDPPAINQTDQGACRSLLLPKHLNNALNALSQKSGCTLFMTLLAAFKVFLYRYLGQEDIFVNSVNAVRNQVEPELMESSNILVLRTSLTTEQSFSEWLHRVCENSFAYADQDLLLAQVEELDLERNQDDSPHQVLFALNPSETSKEVSEIELPETINSLSKDVGETFDLTLVMRETNQGLKTVFEYNTDVFDGDTIARMLECFQTLLEGIVANPDQSIATLPLLPPAQRHQLLVEWNNTQANYPATLCIHQLVEQQVEQSPNAVAIVAGKQQLTYRELNQRANQLAHYLRAQGVGAEVLVALYVERSLLMIVAILGILKAGGAFLPLDPIYPQARRDYNISDSQPALILTQAHLVSSLPQCDAQVVLLDADWETIAQNSVENPPSQATPQNLAYVIYTSGSTGKPKGVTVTHGSIVNHSTAIAKAFDLQKSDRVLQFSSMSFDVMVEELFPTWICGATVVLLWEEAHTSIAQFLQFIIAEQLTVLNLPTAFWHELVNGLSTLKQPLPISVRLLIVGGEKPSHSTYLNWLELVGQHPRWLNCYGLTETTVTSIVYDPATTATISSLSELPIGRPLANTQVYILDRQLQPVPIGVPGELYIGGAGLARGYLNQPELTQEKFIPNPFVNSESGSRKSESQNYQLAISNYQLAITNSQSLILYKTGDKVRYLPDGNIEFLGRIDNQVKMRGFRIELGEIEAALAQHPSVQQTVVIVREDVPGNQRLVAYIVAHQHQASPSDVRDFLQQKLPNYMVPSAFVFLDTLPLTPNGKVDRRSLPDPNHISQFNENFVASRDEVEIQLAKVWEKVFGIQPISIKDNFFDLGGHSLLAVRLFAEIEKAFNKNLPLAVLLQAPTIEQLANILRQQEWSAPWSPLVTIQDGGSKPPLFCIHGGGFNVLIYRDLALNLGSDQPVYGLQARGLDGNEPLHNSLEDMASDYIKQIRLVQPEGPYFLAGLSNGGVVALEMAQQLQAQVQEVALVAMFDSYGPDSVKLLPPLPRLLSSLNYALHYSIPRFTAKALKLGPKATLTAAIAGLGFFKRSSKQLDRSQDEQPRAEQTLSSINRAQGWMNKLSSFILKHSPWSFFTPINQLQHVDGSLSDTLKKIEEAYGKVHDTYVPRVYSGRITLFRAQETPPGFYIDPQQGWSKIAAKGVEVYKIPGHHVSIMESTVLAEKLRDCLDRATNEFKTEK